MDIAIEEFKTFSVQDADAIRRLASQEGANYKELTNEDMQEMLDSSATHVLVAREPKNHQVIGMVTLIVCRIPYVKKSTLEDLVVDDEYRGQGIARQLMEAGLALAKQLGAAYVDLTARPIRTASNSLYVKLGFTKRDTNVYRMIYDYGEV